MEHHCKEDFALITRGQSVLNSLLSNLVTSFSSEREALLESSTDLETLYRKAALHDNTASSPAEEEVDLHYVCFVKSSSGLFYEMNDANGPIIMNVTLEEDQDLLKSSALEYVKRCIARSEEDIQFSLLALVHNISNSR